MDEVQKIWPQWEIVGLIGKGAFGKVYKVKREQLGNVSYAAVKVIHIPLDEGEIRELQHSGMDAHSVQLYFLDMVKNLFNEIKILENLKSANNIVNIEDYEVIEHTKEIGWDIYIRMELLTDLGSYLEETHKMSVSEVVKLGIDICSALVDCEKENIIHRDIKIDNVFVTKFGIFKLGDFGISKQLEKTQSALSQKGTNMYMAPEVFRGEHYNHTVDIYSLGIMMYRLLNNGRFPFMSPINRDIRYDDTQKAMEKRLSGAVMGVPACADKDLGKIILKACSFAPEDRYQSAKELKQDLEYYFGLKLKQSERLINISMDQRERDSEDDGKTVAAFEAKGPMDKSALEKTDLEQIKEENRKSAISVMMEIDNIEDSINVGRVGYEDEKTESAFGNDTVRQGYEDIKGDNNDETIEEVIPVSEEPLPVDSPQVYTSPRTFYSFKEFYKYNCPINAKIAINVSAIALYIICVIKFCVILNMLILIGDKMKIMEIINIILDPIIVLSLALCIHIKKSEYGSRFLLAYSVFMLLSARLQGLGWWLLLFACAIAQVSTYEAHRKYGEFLDHHGYRNGDSKLRRSQKSKWRRGLSEEKLYIGIAAVGVCIGIAIIFFLIVAASNEEIYDFIYKYMSFLDPDI